MVRAPCHPLPLPPILVCVAALSPAPAHHPLPAAPPPPPPQILSWVDDDGDAAGQTFCDAGCGVGSLAIPLAARGAVVTASDISPTMAAEAARRAAAALDAPAAARATFRTADLCALDGFYDTVACVDVMIHYPQADVDEMIAALSARAKRRLIVSFAPKTLAYSLFKKVGEFFPGPSKATRAYLHAEADVVAALEAQGWTIRRRGSTASKFYFSNVLEAVREA